MDIEASQEQALSPQREQPAATGKDILKEVSLEVWGVCGQEAAPIRVRLCPGAKIPNLKPFL